MNPENIIPISEYYKLAVLDLHKIRPERCEWTGKYWAYYEASKVQDLLNQYDSGSLQVNAADFVDALKRVKDRIFESQGSHRKKALWRL